MPYPKKWLKEFVNKHEGSKFVVVGCGESAKLAVNLPDHIITIGVNDIGRLFWPDYLVVIDPSSKFKGIRKDVVHNNKCKYMFTQLQSWKPASMNRVLIELKSRKLEYINHPYYIDYSNHSPYVAAMIAFKMGAKEIGFLGNDFADNHFYEKDGTHNLISNNKRKVIEEDYRKMRSAFNNRGTKLWTLSESNTISTLPYKKLSEFIK